MCVIFIIEVLGCRGITIQWWTSSFFHFFCKQFFLFRHSFPLSNWKGRQETLDMMGRWMNACLVSRTVQLKLVELSTFFPMAGCADSSMARQIPVCPCDIPIKFYCLGFWVLVLTLKDISVCCWWRAVDLGKCTRKCHSRTDWWKSMKCLRDEAVNIPKMKVGEMWVLLWLYGASVERYAEGWLAVLSK
jgi:hypothetical protein